MGWVSSCASELRLKHSHTQSHYTLHNTPPRSPPPPPKDAPEQVTWSPQSQNTSLVKLMQRRRKSEEFAVVSQFVSTKTIPQSVWTKPDPHKLPSLQIPGEQVWLDLLDKVSVWCPAVGLILLCCCCLGFCPRCITVWEKWGLFSFSVCFQFHALFSSGCKSLWCGCFRNPTWFYILCACVCMYVRVCGCVAQIYHMGVGFFI